VFGIAIRRASRCFESASRASLSIRIPSTPRHRPGTVREGLQRAAPGRHRTAWLTTDPGSRVAGWKEIGASSRGKAIFHGVL
jgi:hypothetical protein